MKKKKRGHRPKKPDKDRPKTQLSDRPKTQLSDRPKTQLSDRPKTQLSDRPNKSHVSDTTGWEVVPYSDELARAQEMLHKGVCSVCKKEGYGLNTCGRCQVAKWCGPKCRLIHRQQIRTCQRVSRFNIAKANIPRRVMKHLFVDSGYRDISCFLHSIPNAERYFHLDASSGLRTAVLVEIINLGFCFTSYNVSVKDLANKTTTFIFRTILSRDGVPTFVSTYDLQPGNFLLLLNGHWNYHYDKTSAAVHVQNLNCVEFIAVE